MHLYCAAQARWWIAATRVGDGLWSVVEPPPMVPHPVSGGSNLHGESHSHDGG